MSYKRYWVALAIVIIGSFAVLGGVGRKMISQAPPIPDVYTTDGQLLFTGTSITDGQGVWQSIGGQEIGTVWGHGAYVAPDWSADWLHRESEILLNTWAVRAGAANFESLGPDRQAIFKARLIREMRTNTYDASRMQSSSMQTLRWMRVPGDIRFAIGAALFAWFVLGLLTGYSYSKEGSGIAKSSLCDQNEEHFVALAGR